MQTQNCPNCNYSLNPEIGIEGETRSPTTGLLTVCIHCAILLKFDATLALKLATDIDSIALQEPAIYRKLTVAQSRVAVGNGHPYPPNL